MRVSFATSVSVVGDANIDNQISTAGRVRQVVDDLDISALLARARGNRRKVVSGSPIDICGSPLA